MNTIIGNIDTADLGICIKNGKITGYESIEEANKEIPYSSRFRGMVVLIGEDLASYWYRDGIEDNHLIKM